jgi:hypothetical protein
MKDFFLSYNKADKNWADWIAWTLEARGYSTIIQRKKGTNCMKG